MNSPDIYATITAPSTARTGVSLGRLWHTFVDALRRLRAESPASDTSRFEQEALAGLDAHMLKDIGASDWLVADAAMHSRDELHRRIDMGLG